MILSVVFHRVLILLLGLSLQTGGGPGKVPPAVITAIKTGNYRELAKHFYSSVELVVLESENVYSKAQAELIIRDFFAKYPPTGFLVRHEEARDNLCYAIGKLSTQKGEFRIVILLKTKDGTSQIHQLRIEKDNGES